MAYADQIKILKSSLNGYSAEEKKAHNKAVVEHFGKSTIRTWIIPRSTAKSSHFRYGNPLGKGKCGNKSVTLQYI